VKRDLASAASLVLAGALVMGWSCASPAMAVTAQATPGQTRSEAPDRAGAAAPAATPRVGVAAEENDDNDNAARLSSVNSTATLEVAGGTVKVIYPLLPASGPDAVALGKLADGAVLELTRSMAIKLSTGVELDFAGGAAARPGNVTPGYPGVYSLWLKRAGDDWRLVLNREPDIWGTMRDPAADSGEATLSHTTVPDAEKAATLEARLDASNGGGTLTLRWGGHRFVANFDARPAKGASP